MSSNCHRSFGVVESFSLSLSLPNALKSASISSSKTIFDIQTKIYTKYNSCLHPAWTSPSIYEDPEARFRLRSHCKLCSSIIEDTITLHSLDIPRLPILCLWFLPGVPRIKSPINYGFG